MSTFSVTVCEVTILSHPNADRLSLAQLGDYLCVVGKDNLKTGDLVAYIPEGSVVPLDIQKELGVEGKLAGSKKDRVKAVLLRGILSQGLVYPAKPHWKLGDDVATELGIEKYEPGVPESLRGAMFNAGLDFAFKYDIENIKKHPNVIHPGTDVVFTEKIHGTNCRVTIVPETINHPECGRLWVASKGLGSQGLCFKDLEDSPKNVYMQMAKRYFTPDVLAKLTVYEPISFFGEVFGKSIQDLGYGLDGTEFRVFDIFIGKPGTGFFVDIHKMQTMCQELGLPTVPILYQGPFSKDVLDTYTTGRETISGKSMHVREGVVVRPVEEKTDYSLPMNRVQLKSVSADYLLRKGNVTEYA